MWIEKCIETAKKLIADGHLFFGFDPETTPRFESYALQSAYPVAHTFIDSKIDYGEKCGVSPEDSYTRVLEEFLLAQKIWNRLVTEQEWTSENFRLFQKSFLDYKGLGNDTFLSYCISSKWEEYEIIEHANRCWNNANPNEKPKPTSLPHERAATELKRFDEANQKVREKGLADLHHYTKGQNIDGLNDRQLAAVFGDNAQCIIHIKNYMANDEATSIRLRRDLVKQHEAHLAA